MNVLALCSGVGGLELGTHVAVPAARCICYVEGEAYAAAVLAARMAEGCLDDAPIWSDVKSFDGKPWRGVVDCVAGGYPCQPFSQAGKRKGADDPRHLWPHIARIVAEVGPRLCFFENVSGHLSLGFEAVADDLSAMGYAVAAGLFTASEVGATHRRQRLYIMAHAAEKSEQRITDGVIAEREPRLDALSTGRGRTVADYVPECFGVGSQLAGGLYPPGPTDSGGWERYFATAGNRPVLSRVGNGVANRVDRVNAAGNGVVPLAAAYAWRVLADSLGVG